MSLEPHLLLGAMSFVVDLHDDASNLELFAAHRLLEPEATAIAASRVPEEDMKGLRAEVNSVDDHTSIK